MATCALRVGGPVSLKGHYPLSCTCRCQPGRRLSAAPAVAPMRRPSRLAVRASTDEPGSLMRPRIKVPASARKTVSPPKPTEIIHSSTYTLSEDLGSDDFTNIEIKEEASDTTKAASRNDNETPLQAVLERADRSMASIEENPPAVAKAFWDVANGPVGDTASKGLRAAINTTVKVGKEAATAAAPAGKWAAKQGVKLLFSAVSKGVQGESSKSKKDGDSGRQ